MTPTPNTQQDAAAQTRAWVAAANAPENAGLTIREAEQAVRDKAHAAAVPACPAGDSCTGAAFPGHPAHALRNQATDADEDDTCADCLERPSDPSIHCVECGDHIDGTGTCVNCGAEVTT